MIAELRSCGLSSFDFCMPPKDEMWKNSPAENLGQVVFGERIRPSIYKVLHVCMCGHCCQCRIVVFLYLLSVRVGQTTENCYSNFFKKMPYFCLLIISGSN